MPDRTTCRPRIEGERESEIFTAVVALLVEAGYDKLTFDAVATAVRASKATLYRRWPTKADLVARRRGRPSSPPPSPSEDDDTGSPARRPARPGLPAAGACATTSLPCSAPSSRRCTATPSCSRRSASASSSPSSTGRSPRSSAPASAARSAPDADLHLLANTLPAICVHDTFVFDIHATPERVAHVMDSVVLPGGARHPAATSRHAPAAAATPPR